MEIIDLIVSVIFRSCLEDAKLVQEVLGLTSLQLVYNNYRNDLFFVVGFFSGRRIYIV